MLGDLSYTYDNGGRRIATSGSLARAALPDALIDAAVDAANRLTAAGTQTLTYDANGNLSGDGSRQYVWNARDQLVQIKDSAGAVIAAFTYDALGRRQTKTVDGAANGYVYDGLNIVQELAGAASANDDPASVKASYVGAGLDEVFAQLSGTGESAAILTYLTDALGSTIRLADAAGAKMVEYTYDPYGNTTADNTSINNPFQYTGRENDGTGLYYYRARYYSPMHQRFISSDPIGLAGGINEYAYTNGNPISYIDPHGHELVLAGIGAVIGGISGGISAANQPGSTVSSIALGALVGGVLGGASGLVPGLGGMIAGGIGAGGADAYFQLTDPCKKPNSLYQTLMQASLGLLVGSAAGKLEGPIANYLGPMNADGLAKQFAGSIGLLAGFGVNTGLPGSQGGLKP